MTGEAPLVLRDADEADLDALIALERSCFSNPWPRAAFEQELRTPFARLWLAAAPDEAGDVGFADFWLHEDELHLLSLAIRPSHRRRGLARWLLERVEETGIADGAAMGLLEVRTGNRAAQGLYRGAGYDQVGLRRRYYSDNGEDALVFLKFLGGGA